MSKDSPSSEKDASESISFQLLPATPDDAEAILALNKRAFRDDYLMSQVYPKEKSHLTSPETLFAWRVRRLRTEIGKGEMLFSKVIKKDDPRPIIAQAGWTKPGIFVPGLTLLETHGKSTIQPSKEAESSRDAESRNVPDSPSTAGFDDNGFPACMNVALHHEFLARMDTGETTHGPAASITC